MKHIEINTERLSQITTLKYGSHNSFERGACAMEAASYIAGEKWSDHPECVCPVIGAFMRMWNDGLPNDEDRSRLLLPLITKIVGTRSTTEIETIRANMAADWFIRVNIPSWLELAGLKTQASMLRSFPEITDFAKVPPLMPALREIQGDAYAAGAAAGAAAGYDTWAVAWTVAWAVAWAALRQPAAAARAAAGAAAGTAAGYDAGDNLKPTVTILQQSAVALVERMAEVRS